jgi:hypothetical protein
VEGRGCREEGGGRRARKGKEEASFNQRSTLLLALLASPLFATPYPSLPDFGEEARTKIFSIKVAENQIENVLGQSSNGCGSGFFLAC